ncbi:MAG: type 4a pilus biogenesis protein PilO [Candidatus Omnitrophica bacterium]|nr:type 4a pilus biogenesis protein PilO [Candidatus Omnitrophota bacterium]
MEFKLDFLKKAKKNEIIVFTVLICGIILIGYVLLFFNPIISKLSDISRKVSKMQSDLNIASLSIESMPKMEKEVSGLKQKAIAYSNKLPREEEFPALLERLSAMAQTADVKITKIAPIKDADSTAAEKTVSPSAIYQAKGIMVNAQCGYHQLGNFISELERDERFMDVSDITIESVKTAPRRHNVQLIVKTFVLKDKNQ